MKKSSAQGIAARIREVRRREGLTQSVFAERLGVPQKKISDIERCRTAPNPGLLVSLRAEFGITIDWLLTGQEPELLSEVQQAHDLDQVKIGRVLTDLKHILQDRSIEKLMLTGEAGRDNQKARAIPLFELNSETEVKFGENGLPLKENAETLFVPPIVDDPEAFACRLQLDHMAPEFEAGTVLIFTPSKKADNGDYVCAHFENQCVFRQLFMDGSTYRLVAANRKYPEIKVPAASLLNAIRLGFAVSRY